MTSVGNILFEKEILLESGTNELEILVFRLADYTFGINVAKVREVLPAVSITCLPKAHKSVLGVFKLRETVVPIVSLRRHLNVRSSTKADDQTFILTDFNHHQTAFAVDSVERIHRLSWEHILSVPSLSALHDTPVTAVARIGDRLVIMLDFEMISDQVTEQFFRTGRVDNPHQLPREDLRIVLVDDSPTVRQAIEGTLRSSGYTNLSVFDNGLAAWKWLESRASEADHGDRVADLVISDVEMPQVDGLHLTKRIKQHPGLNSLPVMLYSSIVTPDNRKKGEAVGADAQVSKPDLTRVVELADDLIVQAMERPPECAAEEPTTLLTTSAQAGSAANAPPPCETAPSPATQCSSASITNASTSAASVSDDSQVAWSAKLPDASSARRIAPSLWATFRSELGERAGRLRQLCEAAASGKCDEASCNEAFRTLHTIKSAAMVMPVDEVSRLAHLMEELLEPVRQAAGRWPHADFERFLDYLDDLTQPQCDVPQTLVAGRRLLAELSEARPSK
jgi:two-component system chemotaxis response regulator CheV